MKLSNEAEEVLEELWVLVEEGGGTTASSGPGVGKDDTVVKELSELDYVAASDQSMKLTRKGKEEAKSIVRRHRLAERLMTDVLDLKKEIVHEEACEFEHILHKEVEESICSLLGHPKVCPHGKMIPQGECCRKAESTISPVVSSLVELKPGQGGKIAYLHGDSQKELQKLMSFGVLPGTIVQLIQRFPSYLLQAGHTQVAMDEEMAKNVCVRRSK